ncbi:MAG TPA: hypothetical protein VLI05_07230 [Candidatus Saccharimonadia bacterium]|nr:hypothetical protein [Candidatus Saccharimonadia bacterium]
MKTKDIVIMVVAALIFLVAGYLAYTQLVPKSSSAASQGVQVEVVGSIAPGFDSGALSTLQDSSKVHNYAVPLDLTTGLGNQAIFGH